MSKEALIASLLVLAPSPELSKNVRDYINAIIKQCPDCNFEGGEKMKNTEGSREKFDLIFKVNKKGGDCLEKFIEKPKKKKKKGKEVCKPKSIACVLFHKGKRVKGCQYQSLTVECSK